MCACPFALLLFSLCKKLNFGENHEVNGVLLLLPGVFDREMSVHKDVFINYLYKSSAPQRNVCSTGEAKLTWAGFQRGFSRHIPSGTSGRWWSGLSWAPQC